MQKINNNVIIDRMNKKKEILKKYTGKGGIITDTIKEIPGTFMKGLKGLGRGIRSGIKWAGNQVAKDMQIEDQKSNKLKKAMKAARMGKYLGPKSDY